MLGGRGLAVAGTVVALALSLLPPAFAAGSVSAPLLRAAAAARERLARGVAPANIAAHLSGRFMRVNARLEVEVYVALDRWDPAVAEEIAALGGRVTQQRPRNRLLGAWVPLDGIEAVAAIPAVDDISLPSYAFPRVGSVTSEGDAVLAAAALRQTFGVDGSGVKIGVLSNGAFSRAEAQASGDLPPDTELIFDPGHVGSPGEEEATALMEIIHDLAPGARLGFYAVRNSIDFFDGLDFFEEMGISVTVDDLGFPTEPYFEDGGAVGPFATVAGRVKQALDRGISYHSAAGNEAQVHYEGEFVDSGVEVPGSLGCPAGTLHDFGNGDVLQAVRIAAGGRLATVLQWSDPFLARTGDYDLALFDASGQIPLARACLGCGEWPPDAAIECLSFPNATATALDVNVGIVRVSGPPRRLEMFHFSDPSGTAIPLEHVVTEGSVFGHPAVSGVIAAGAVSFSAPDFVEPFSARGPSEIFFPQPESRTKPDLVATDGVSVSGAGGFPSPFFGTSAAAPHSAAIAALLRDLRPDLASTEIVATLITTAEDIGTPGSDPLSGWGRIQALAAGVSIAPQATLAGDLNRDGRVTARDAFLALQIVLDPARFDAAADVAPLGAPDGEVTALDALAIFRAALGLIVLGGPG